MFRNIKLTIRNLRRNGVYSFINIVGLAISLATCVFIILWVQDEKSYDRFHKDAENIYMTVTHFENNSGKIEAPRTTGMFATTAKDIFGGVEDYCRILQEYLNYLKYEDVKSSSLSIIIADPNFFDFFNFPIVAGNRGNPLQNVEDAVISERLAKILFGNEDPVGKTISMEDERTINVAAVMKNMPQNTYLTNADLVCSIKLFPSEWSEDWLSNIFSSFIRVMPGTDVSPIAEKITEMLPSERAGFVSYSMQPLVNLHLYSLKGEPAGIKTVKLFQWVALIILVIACINYVNLVTARASKRHREMGVKKIVGAKRYELFAQLIGEALVLFVFAAVLAMALNWSLHPVYKIISGKEMAFSLFDAKTWLIYLGMLISVVCLAGLYPAYMLSSYRSVHLLQSVKSKSGNSFFRKVLVVLQFTATTALITGTIVLLLQMKYMREKDLGYHRERIMMCYMNNMMKSYDVVKAELERQPSISGITIASSDIMNVTQLFGFGNWTGKTIEGGSLHKVLFVDTSFVQIMGLKLIEGANFTSIKSGRQYILNEAAVKSMGITDNPVGKWINDNTEEVIVGVVKDFHFESLYREIEPLVLYHAPNYSGSILYVRVNSGSIPQAISALEVLWSQYNPDYAFDYWFLDDTFNKMYKSEIQTNKLFGIFSIIAIVISCLGLLGLIVFTAEMKRKEIGIRKVLGATIFDIVILLTKEFLILVGIAILIAIPLAYYWLDSMLQNFAYHISLSWWIFAVAAWITVVLTLLTVCVQGIKAATENPVNAIKSD